MVLQLQLPLRGSSFQFATWESRELQVEDIQTSLTGKFVDFGYFVSLSGVPVSFMFFLELSLPYTV